MTVDPQTRIQPSLCYFRIILRTTTDITYFALNLKDLYAISNVLLIFEDKSLNIYIDSKLTNRTTTIIQPSLFVLSDYLYIQVSFLYGQ